MFTAAQTELGKSEEWFWDVTPRVLVVMLREKEKLDIRRARYFACLNNGVKIDEPEDEEDERGIPGIDFPVDERSLGF